VLARRLGDAAARESIGTATERYRELAERIPPRLNHTMNGWGDAEPAWWLNLQTHPDVTVDLVEGPRQVTGRAAHGDARVLGIVYGLGPAAAVAVRPVATIWLDGPLLRARGRD
jgi:hypothetical protein